MLQLGNFVNCANEGFNSKSHVVIFHQSDDLFCEDFRENFIWAMKRKA
jgi:hypothetical protein